MELTQQGTAPLRNALPLLLAPTCSMDLEDIPIDLHQVKASFLFNLLRFIEWPADTQYPKDRLSLYICGAFSLRAFEALDGARIGKHTIVVRRIPESDLTVARASKAHILVISSDVPVLNVPISRGLLTVGETDGFTACGGIMNLLHISGRMRYQINDEIAQACGLRVDARLLNLQMR